ncbi:putative squamosa promoter-binding-like protein 19 [Acorus calamus]|uniref:Squamosa promoter-binding-like protein 19 n=1 Tax=Acorus calamus TaxID=4465 RepID=A0AAV9FFP9_ACOCL|nr:putative squamosa promoter-binding-like protein 19 [Acorus calamus]
MVKRCLLFESSSSENEEEKEGSVEKVKHKITDHKAVAEEEDEEEESDDDSDVSFKIIYRTDVAEEKEVSSPPPSPSPPPKKKKRVVKATATPTPKKRRGILKCQVEGCEEDISGSKAYYRNHKICEGHYKAPVVRVGGVQERFCQRCTRFHELLEFDGSKRTCRKSLEAHNKRRRKFVTLPELDDVDTELVLGFQDSKNNSRMTVDQSGKRMTDLLLRPTFKHFKLR